LCLVYANAEAQALLGISFNRVRGRPVAELLREPTAITSRLRSAIENRTAMSASDVMLKAAPLQGSATAESVHLQANAFEDDMTGSHLVVRMIRAGRAPMPARARTRRRGAALASAALCATPLSPVEAAEAMDPAT
jgi:nitrogen-specific signal transduction histidine kinase